MRENRSISCKVFKGLLYILIFFLCVNGVFSNPGLSSPGGAGAQVEAAETLKKFSDNTSINEIYISNTGKYIYYVATHKNQYEVDVQYFYKYDINSGVSTELVEFEYMYMGKKYCYQNDKLYYSGYEESYYGAPHYIFCLDLITGEKTKLFTLDKRPEDVSYEGMFIDTKGMLYIVDRYSEKRNIIYGEDGSISSYTSYFLGYKLTKTDTAGNKIFTTDLFDFGLEDILQIDGDTGLIYFTVIYNWVYWGYDHDMLCFNVARMDSNGKLTYPADDNYISILYQYGFFEHEQPAEFLGDKYFAVLSPFARDALYILDAKKIKPEDVVENDTSISLVDSSVSVSPVNLRDETATILVAQTNNSNYVNDKDTTNIGSRCAMLSENGIDTFYVITGENRIDKYPINKKTSTGYIETEYPIFKIMNVGGKLTVLEKKDNALYIEQLNTSVPKSMTIQGKNSITAGETMTCSIIYDSVLKIPYSFESSDSSIASVDSYGNVTGWKPGTVTITAKSKDGTVSSSLRVTVTARSIGRICYDKTPINGEVTNNLNDNNYSTHASEVTSYLEQIDSGNFMRAEMIENNTLLVEYFNTSGTVTGSRRIDGELVGIAGFYAGASNYFVVCAQANDEESDDTEILRIVKYDKNWNRVGSCSLSGINTKGPVDAGTLRMVEYNGILYIHTCHTMYQSSDGYNHQANMSFAIDESSMNCVDSYSDVMNLSMGYVSHSFNQFITVSDGWIYRSDHGDAFPRGISVTGFKAGGKLGAPEIYGTMLGVDGGIGVNYTGISEGGFEVSKTSYIAAYNQDISDYGNRNIKVVSTDMLTGEKVVNDITTYSSSDGITCLTPQLVKLNDFQFLLMWVEKNTSNSSSQMVYQLLNGEGVPVGGKIRNGYKISDCQPILLSDGTVAWYTSDGNSVTLYNIDPFNITASDEKWDDISDGNNHKSSNGQEGWNKDANGNWRYQDGKGGYSTGWVEIDGSWYYFDQNGLMARNEYRDGYWLGTDGKMIPSYSGKWKGNSSGWWFEDESGWYPVSQWLKINGNWYYFGSDGYMVSGEYREGCWIDNDGVMNPSYTHGIWKVNSTGWWFEDNGWYPCNQWLKIDGYWYFFGEDGYMCTDEWRDGYYLDSSGALLYSYTGSWHYSGGWWFGDESGWYAHDQWVKINGQWYWFDSSGISG